jgi:dolichyl-phosphate beta-glucosyltransferase
VIGEAVRRIHEALAPIGAGDFEVVVVDDGSRDATARRAKEAGAVVVSLSANLGKGAAVRAGAAASRGRAIAYTDADLSYAPEQLVGLLEQVEAGWDVVVGSRAHIDTRTLVASRRLREVTGRLFNLMTSMVLLGRYRDTQCGLKAFRHDVAEVLFSHARLDGFAFDVELFHLVERYRLSLVEVPVTVAHSTRSTVRVALDAWRMVRDLFRVRWWAGRGVYDLSADEASVLGR